MENEHKQLESTHAVYHRILQPAYERMILQNVYKNKINLKSGASAQLLHKRPKTTGYLGKRRDGSSYPAGSTYWNPSVNESWLWQQSFAPSSAPSVGYLQDAPRTLSHPLLTDEQNMKTSSRANTFSATTRVREVPVSGIYKKEIQEFRSRTPSARGVRASAITNRTIVASQSAKTPSVRPKTTHISQQSSRLEREHVQLELTRERKRQSQVSSHRVDRMYYMLGSPTKIHQKYAITEDDLDRLRAIAISRGMKVPSFTNYNPGVRPSSTSGPHSTPREEEDLDVGDLHRQGSAKTIIPTAETTSVGGEISADDKDATISWKEDKSTSDHEDDGMPDEVLALPPSCESKDGDESRNIESMEHQSVKSDSALLKLDTEQKNVAFLTEKDMD